MGSIDSGTKTGAASSGQPGPRARAGRRGEDDRLAERPLVAGRRGLPVRARPAPVRGRHVRRAGRAHPHTPPSAPARHTDPGDALKLSTEWFAPRPAPTGSRDAVRHGKRAGLCSPGGGARSALVTVRDDAAFRRSAETSRRHEPTAQARAARRRTGAWVSPRRAPRHRAALACGSPSSRASRWWARCRGCVVRQPHVADRSITGLLGCTVVGRVVARGRRAHAGSIALPPSTAAVDLAPLGKGASPGEVRHRRRHRRIPAPRLRLWSRGTEPPPATASSTKGPHERDIF